MQKKNLCNRIRDGSKNTKIPSYIITYDSNAILNLDDNGVNELIDLIQNSIFLKNEFNKLFKKKSNMSTNLLFIKYKNKSYYNINKRVTNFEIVLNKFANEDKDILLNWIFYVIRDILMNPNIKLPKTYVEVNNSLNLLKRIIQGQ